MQDYFNQANHVAPIVAGVIGAILIIWFVRFLVTLRHVFSKKGLLAGVFIVGVSLSGMGFGSVAVDKRRPNSPLDVPSTQQIQNEFQRKAYTEYLESVEKYEPPKDIIRWPWSLVVGLVGLATIAVGGIGLIIETTKETTNA